MNPQNDDERWLVQRAFNEGRNCEAIHIHNHTWEPITKEGKGYPEDVIFDENYRVRVKI